MSLVYELGISSAAAVTLTPDRESFMMSKRQIRDEHRVKSGALFMYSWGSYERINIECAYVPGSEAMTVNSWWSTNTKLLFFVTSDSVTEVHSVMILNEDKPFDKHSPPYVDLWKGIIQLEGY